ncbi:F-box only protein 50 [Gastrophryne carolinensis]
MSDCTQQDWGPGIPTGGPGASADKGLMEDVQERSRMAKEIELKSGGSDEKAAQEKRVKEEKHIQSRGSGSDAAPKSQETTKEINKQGNKDKVVTNEEKQSLKDSLQRQNSNSDPARQLDKPKSDRIAKKHEETSQEKLQNVQAPDKGANHPGACQGQDMGSGKVTADTQDKYKEKGAEQKEIAKEEKNEMSPKKDHKHKKAETPLKNIEVCQDIGRFADKSQQHTEASANLETSQDKEKNKGVSREQETDTLDFQKQDINKKMPIEPGRRRETVQEQEKKHTETSQSRKKPSNTSREEVIGRQVSLELEKQTNTIQKKSSQDQERHTEISQKKPSNTSQEQVIGRQVSLELEKQTNTDQKKTPQDQEKHTEISQKKPSNTSQEQVIGRQVSLELEKQTNTDQKKTSQDQEKHTEISQNQENNACISEKKPSNTSQEQVIGRQVSLELEKQTNTDQKKTPQDQEKQTGNTRASQKKPSNTSQEQVIGRQVSLELEKANTNQKTSLDQEKHAESSQSQEKNTGIPQDQKKPSETSQEQVIGKEISQQQLEQGNTECDVPIGPPKFKQTETAQEQQKGHEVHPHIPVEVKEPETAEGWFELCNKEWRLNERSVVIPNDASWKDIYKKKPFGRNFLKSPNPEGLSTSQPPPAEEVDPPPQKRPLETLGDFSGWQISTEEIPVDTSKVPPGVVVCYLPVYSWCVKEQMVDLLSEGLWPELLDSYQPDIYVLDWYEDSKLHKNVYELHVALLAEDKKTVLAQLDLAPENDMSGEPKGWNFISHIFKSYGPGVRFIHFLQKSKDLSVLGFHRTRIADSTLFAQLRD